MMWTLTLCEKLLQELDESSKIGIFGTACKHKEPDKRLPAENPDTRQGKRLQ